MIQLRNVSYNYDSGAVGVQEISLSINYGDKIGFIGRTGCGKSTLAQIIAGLQPPGSGDVFLDGVNLYPTAKKFAVPLGKIGLVFQYPEHQFFEETVYNDIAFGAKQMGLRGDALECRVLSAADFLGIPSSLLHKSPFELSGGEKRRAAIAGIFCMQPQLLILDEPTAGLDNTGKQLLFKILKTPPHWCKCFVLISHSMLDIAAYTNHVIVLDEGRILQRGSVSEVFANLKQPSLLGLSRPLTLEISQKLADKGYNIRPQIYSTAELAERILSSNIVGCN